MYIRHNYNACTIGKVTISNSLFVSNLAFPLLLSTVTGNWVYSLCVLDDTLMRLDRTSKSRSYIVYGVYIVSKYL